MLLLIALACASVADAAAPSQRPAALGELPGTYEGPNALALAPDGTTLFVACADSNRVACIALPAGQVTRRLTTPSQPTGVAVSPDGRRLAVTCAAPRSTVLLFDTATGAPAGVVAAGHTAVAPLFSPDGRRLYVANRFDSDVSIIDSVGCKELLRLPAIREPVALAVTPDGGKLLVANHLPLARTDPEYRGDVAATITVIDTATQATGAIVLPHGSTGVRGICLSPDGRKAFVPHLLSNFEQVPFRIDGGWINVNVVSVVDIARRRVLQTIGMDVYDAAAGNPWDIVCAAGGKAMCTSLSGTHELAVIPRLDLENESAQIMTPMMGVWPIYPSLGESAWQRVKLSGQGPRALVAAGSKVYAAQYFSDSIAVVDLAVGDGGKLVQTIALGPEPKLTQVRRGELLFHDATICYQHWQSCASCHPDARVDGINWDLTNDGEGNSKNTKSMLWAHRTPPAMAEGVRMSAEQAVRSGLEHILFVERPEDEPAAIDAYLKTLTPTPSPRLVDGRLSPAAARGQVLFSRPDINCDRCHPSPLYTDKRSHPVGTRGRYDRSDRFDTPTLVEVWRTAPYLHDGRYTTVWELLHDGKHGLQGRPVKLSDAELRDLAEFVLSL